MPEGENINLGPDGKRKWSKRKGLVNPMERRMELEQQEEDNANEIRPITVSQPALKKAVQKDLPLDHADKIG